MVFPCNQFGGQEPWPEAKIKAAVVEKYGEQFLMSSKIDVNGKNTHPVYQFLKKAYPGDITWNFAAKFIVNRNGVPVARFNKMISWTDIEAFIIDELKAINFVDEEATPQLKAIDFVDE